VATRRRRPRSPTSCPPGHGDAGPRRPPPAAGGHGRQLPALLATGTLARHGRHRRRRPGASASLFLAMGAQARTRPLRRHSERPPGRSNSKWHAMCRQPAAPELTHRVKIQTAPRSRRGAPTARRCQAGVPKSPDDHGRDSVLRSVYAEERAGLPHRRMDRPLAPRSVGTRIRVPRRPPPAARRPPSAVRRPPSATRRGDGTPARPCRRP